MAKITQVGVIGLGKFGYKFGTTLLNQGHKVLGVDCNPDSIQRSQKFFTQVFKADATQKEALEQIGLSDLTHVLVSTGNSISSSTMITMYLKELAVQNVWVKAVHEDHAKLLKKVGADEVIIPEHVAASQMAYRIVMPGLIERLPFDPKMVIREISVEITDNKSLSEIDLTNRFDVQVIAIKSHDQKNYRYIPKASDQISRGDVIIVIGRSDTIAKLKL